MPINVETNLDYLIDPLRLHLGDVDSTTYRYMDEWLRTALFSAVKTMQRWWGNKYTVTVGSTPTSYTVERNAQFEFDFEEPPVILDRDERPLVLMAGIIIKAGSLENSSWNFGSWKDAEISYSNIEGSKAKANSLDKDWNELESLVTPPSKKLGKARKQSLVGYINNRYERTENP